MEAKSSVDVAGAAPDHYSCNGSDSGASGQAAAGPLLLCVFVGALSALATCGNLLVIVSIAYFKQLHTPTNCLVLSLAAADLLVGVLVLPFSTALAVSPRSRPSGFLCRVRGAVDVFLCTSSILNLCCISVDRYYVVCRPLAYRAAMSARVTGLMILASWAVPALLGVGIALRGPEEGTAAAAAAAADGGCDIFQSSQSAIVGTFVGFYVPAAVILSLYLKVLAVALRQARSVHAISKRGGSVSKMESKATKTLAIVVGIFLACWAPYFLCMSFYPLSRGAVPVPMVEAFKWFGWSNSMLNPLVYAFFYKWFRSAFKMIVSGVIFRGDFTDSNLC